jgi:hypothetical protein
MKMKTNGNEPTSELEAKAQSAGRIHCLRTQ